MFENKATLRIKAMNQMMKAKPEMAKKKPEMVDEMMGEKGLISMPVTQKEKEMILAMRKAEDKGETQEMEDTETEQDFS